MRGKGEGLLNKFKGFVRYNLVLFSDGFVDMPQLFGMSMFFVAPGSNAIQ